MTIAVSTMALNSSLIRNTFEVMCDNQKMEVAIHNITLIVVVSTCIQPQMGFLLVISGSPTIEALTLEKLFLTCFNILFRTPTTEVVPNNIGSFHPCICQML
jgi:hypothetical protein